MIEVRYDRSLPGITAQGHAGSAPRGRDLVCAALSMLMQTLPAALYDAGIPAEVERRRGYLCVEARPGRRDRCCAERIFDTVFSGLRLLAESRPEHVRLCPQEVMGKETV